MRDHEREIRHAGGGLAAIGLGDARYARAFREETGLGFPLLVDAERRTYEAAGLKKGSLFHLVRLDNFEARRAARAAGHRQHELGQDPFQLGGCFVFAPGDRDVFAHVNDTFGDNAPIPRILAALQAV